MTERERRIQSCIDHIRTSVDIDPWAAELAVKALELMKAEEPKEQPKRLELPDETKAWLDKMDAVEALGTIANICADWDGYRTADALGGLINEIWAYARYCADKLEKAQEPTRFIKISPAGIYECEKCGQSVMTGDIDAYRYCHGCGRTVKWE